MKLCKKCEQTKPRKEFYKLVSKSYKETWDCRDSYCKKCRSIYQSERRRQIKKEAVEYLGGECQKCRIRSVFYEIYDFHHLDPNEKDFSIGKQARSFKSIKAELDKCILLCANCHRIEHGAENDRFI